MIGREIRNPREYSDSLQIECWEFQNVTKTFKFCNIRPEDTYRRITKLSLKTTG